MPLCGSSINALSVMDDDVRVWPLTTNHQSRVLNSVDAVIGALDVFLFSVPPFVVRDPFPLVKVVVVVVVVSGVEIVCDSPTPSSLLQSLVFSFLDRVAHILDFPPRASVIEACVFSISLLFI